MKNHTHIAGNFLAFATIDSAQDGLKMLPQKLLHTTEDTRIFLNNTGTEVHNLLVTNFGELEAHFDSVLDNSGAILTDSLDGMDFETIAQSYDEARKRTVTLQEELIAVKKELLTELEECSSEICQDVRGGLDSLSGMNLDILPVNLPGQTYRSDQTLVDKIASKVNASVDQIRPKISQMRKELKMNDKDLQRYLSDIGELVQSGESKIHEAEPYVEEYGDYPYYLGTELLMITTFHFDLIHNEKIRRYLI